MGPTLGGVTIGFVLLAAVLWPLERLWPAVRRQPLLRPGFRTDLAYWFFTPLVTRVVTRAGLTLALVLLALGAGVPLDRAHIQAFVSSSSRLARSQPAALQVLEVLLLGDLIGYWTHRFFHGRWLWPFHAVHHGSTSLDWLSSVRLHPVNDLLSRVSLVIPILLLGFSPVILAAYVPFLTFYAVFLHANVSWTLGPLGYVLASPAFHRWHHTSEEEGLNKNFAGLFPILDIVFGTFYMPKGRQAEQFGIGDERLPEGLLAQLAYPFRTRVGA